MQPGRLVKYLKDVFPESYANDYVHSAFVSALYLPMSHKEDRLWDPRGWPPVPDSPTTDSCLIRAMWGISPVGPARMRRGFAYPDYCHRNPW